MKIAAIIPTRPTDRLAVPIAGAQVLRREVPFAFTRAHVSPARKRESQSIGYT